MTKKKQHQNNANCASLSVVGFHLFLLSVFSGNLENDKNKHVLLSLQKF